MTRQYVTSRIAADHLGIGVSTLQAWAAKGLVKPAWRTPGGQARWDIEDLERQLDMPPTTMGEPVTSPERTPTDKPQPPAVVTADVLNRPRS